MAGFFADDTRKIHDIRATLASIIAKLMRLPERPRAEVFWILGLWFMSPRQMARSFDLPLKDTLAWTNLVHEQIIQMNKAGLRQQIMQPYYDTLTGFTIIYQGQGLTIVKHVFDGDIETIKDKLLTSLYVHDHLIQLACLFNQIKTSETLQAWQQALTKPTIKSKDSIVITMNDFPLVPWETLSAKEQSQLLEKAAVENCYLLRYSDTLKEQYEEYGLQFVVKYLHKCQVIFLSRDTNVDLILQAELMKPEDILRCTHSQTWEPTLTRAMPSPPIAPASYIKTTHTSPSTFKPSQMINLDDIGHGFNEDEIELALLLSLEEQQQQLPQP